MTDGHRGSRLEALALEGAQRRVRQDLETSAEPARRVRPWAVVALALALFMGGFVLRLSVDDPGALIANTYTVPIALVAMVFGVRAGLAAAAFALLLVWAWGEFRTVDPGPLGYSTRGGVFVLVAVLVGYYSERLKRDIAERRRAEAELEIRAHDLAVSNAELTLAVTRLEAFAEIARAVGGETELRTVLDRILTHGRAIVGARTLVVYLEDTGERPAGASTPVPTGERPAGASTPVHTGERPVGASTPVPGGLAAAAATDGSLAGLPARARSTDDLIASVLGSHEPSLAVRLRWQGETLGALAATGPLEGGSFDDEAEELMGSVAASAATAVATAQSVAADRLRHEIQASEEARARWARELHDETLQGLVGLRMLLASARRSDSPEYVDGAVSDALEQTRREILNLRSLIAELRPAALDELGLDAAIETLSERSAAAAGIEVETQIELRNGDTARLAPDTETTVYRLVQEALSNAARHSGGSVVRVEVAENDDAIVVCVADNGHGFDPAATAGGFGLRGMRERVELAGGWMTIDSSPDGCAVRARVPTGVA